MIWILAPTAIYILLRLVCDWRNWIPSPAPDPESWEDKRARLAFENRCDRDARRLFRVWNELQNGDKNDSLFRD